MRGVPLLRANTGRIPSTPGSPAVCGRSPRWVGPTAHTTCRTYYPTQVMETGHDIIFFWVVRGRRRWAKWLTGQEPFSVVDPAGLDPRPVRQEDVQDQGQRHRPAGGHGRNRRRCPALRADQRRGPRRRSAPWTIASRGWQLRQQALERRAFRAGRKTRRAARRRGPRCPQRSPRARGALEPVPLPRCPARCSTPTPASSSPRPRASFTAPPGPSTATGTWRWPRSGWSGRGRGNPCRYLAGSGVGAGPLPADAPSGHAAHHQGEFWQVPASPTRRWRHADHRRLARRRGMASVSPTRARRPRSPTSSSGFDTRMPAPMRASTRAPGSKPSCVSTRPTGRPPSRRSPTSSLGLRVRPSVQQAPARPTDTNRPGGGQCGRRSPTHGGGGRLGPRPRSPGEGAGRDREAAGLHSSQAGQRGLRQQGAGCSSSLVDAGARAKPSCGSWPRVSSSTPAVDQAGTGRQGRS